MAHRVQPKHPAAALVAAIALAVIIPSAPATTIGAGLVEFSNTQEVTATLTLHRSCAEYDQGSYGGFFVCGYPSGLSYLSSSGALVATYQFLDQTNLSGYVEELDPSTMAVLHVENVSCEPGTPFYPGSGGVFYVPCALSRTSSLSAIYEFGTLSGSYSGSIPTPYFLNSLAWDAPGGLLLGCATPASELIGIFLANGTSYSTHLPLGCNSVVFDAPANALLVATNTSGVDVVYPTNGTVAASILAGTSINDLAIGAQSAWVAVSVTNGYTSPGSFLILSPVSFSTVSSFGFGALPNSQWMPGQLLVDPGHGDLYGVSVGYLVAWNISEGSWVGTMSGMEGVARPAFDLTTDSVYQQDGITGYLWSTSLLHSVQKEITEFLYLPVPVGTLLLGGLVGSLTAVVAWRRLRPGRVLSM